MIRTSGNAKSGRVLLTGARIAAVMGLGLLALGGPASSASITPNSVSPIQHYLDCLGALITDPAAHAANCAPGHDVFVSGSTGYGSVHCKLLDTTQQQDETLDDTSCPPLDD